MEDIDDIVAFICEELSTQVEAAQDLGAETDMTADIAVDSVAVMDLVFALEEKFDISIPLNVLADIHKIGELAALVQRLAGERQERA
ncbi:MAG: acyl carrier protein [Alphaproteobacteria bacterium]